CATYYGSSAWFAYW
nr:immunoglobulin heavy chain junction region [Mus musculus]